MTPSFNTYLDSLILKVKASNEFKDAVFYRAYDGAPAPTNAKGFTVCVGSAAITRERRFLSIYKKRRRTLQTAEFELRVSSSGGAQGLCVFCERLEKKLCAAAPYSVMQSQIGPMRYDRSFDAVYRVITLKVRRYTESGE